MFVCVLVNAGALGHGSLSDEMRPRKVDFFNERAKVVHVSAGGGHTVVVLEDGTVYTMVCCATR